MDILLLFIQLNRIHQIWFVFNSEKRMFKCFLATNPLVRVNGQHLLKQINKFLMTLVNDLLHELESFRRKRLGVKLLQAYLNNFHFFHIGYALLARCSTRPVKVRFVLLDMRDKIYQETSSSD